MTVTFGFMASFLFEAFNSTLYLYLDMMTSTTRLRDPAFKELCARNKSRTRTVVKVLVRPLIIIGSIMPVCCLLADDKEAKTTFGRLHYLIFASCQLVLWTVSVHLLQVRGDLCMRMPIVRLGIMQYFLIPELPSLEVTCSPRR